MRSHRRNGGYASVARLASGASRRLGRRAASWVGLLVAVEGDCRGLSRRVAEDSLGHQRIFLLAPPLVDVDAGGVGRLVLRRRLNRHLYQVTGQPPLGGVGQLLGSLDERRDATDAGETVVAFNPVGEGAVELRFEGVVWGLVKLLALPLASGPIREVRVFTDTRADGEQLVHVAVFSQAADGRGDPRRMIVVQDHRTKKLLREAFAVRSVTEKSETVVTYITPTRRYTYQRIKHKADD